MYDAKVVKQQQALQHRVSELAHESDAEALELVLLYELVQVHRQQLERDADVISEQEMFLHVNDVGRVLRVDPAEVVENADFLLGLSVKPFLIAHHLEGDADAVLVVEGVHHLPETAFADHLQNFIAVGDMIVWYLNHTWRTTANLMYRLCGYRVFYTH